MISCKNGCLGSVVLALIVLAALPTCGVPDGIRPLRTMASFSRNSSSTLWKTYILTSGGRRIYQLSFEPEYGPKNEIIGLDLVLVDAENGKGLPAPNLLNPHNWHGLQPYSFLAKDLVRGPDKSIFGSHRELKLQGKKLFVGIDISNVKVRPLPDDDYEIDQLNLLITVANLLS